MSNANGKKKDDNSFFYVVVSCYATTCLLKSNGYNGKGGNKPAL